MIKVNEQDTQPGTRYVKPNAPTGDFAAGERTVPASPAVGDFASGERNLPISKAVEDYISGEDTPPEKLVAAPPIPPMSKAEPATPAW
jgi:hypothetical protein